MHSELLKYGRQTSCTPSPPCSWHTTQAHPPHDGAQPPVIHAAPSSSFASRASYTVTEEVRKGGRERDCISEHLHSRNLSPKTEGGGRRWSVCPRWSEHDEGTGREREEWIAKRVWGTEAENIIRLPPSLASARIKGSTFEIGWVSLMFDGNT